MMWFQFLPNNIWFVAPQFQLQSITVKQGNFFQLNLQMEAIPYPNSSNWYKESPKGFQALPNGINTNVSYFQIPRVELNHAGTYVLYASNRVGTGSYRFVLNVQGNYMCLHMYVANLEAVQSQDHAGNTSKSHPFLLRFFFIVFL